MRDFDWNDNLWCVVKDNGTYAGVPCLSYEEARELSNQHEKFCYHGNAVALYTLV